MTVPLALALVALMGLGPMIPWRKISPGLLRRTLALPVGVGLGTAVLLAVFTSAADSWKSLLMFGLAAFVAGVVGPGVRARRRGAAHDERRVVVRRARPARRPQSPALWRLHRSTSGFALLLVGVAASSAFQIQRDARLRPGQSIDVDGTKVTYVKPTARLGDDSAGTGAPISFGAVLRAEKDGETQILQPATQLLPGPRHRRVAPSGATSRVRRRARSTSAGARAATCGPPSGRTSRASTRRSARRTGDLPTPPATSRRS